MTNRKITPKLACPTCLHRRSNVVDSRVHPYREAVWRKRQCAHCGTKFETLEILAPTKSDPRLLRNVNI